MATPDDAAALIEIYAPNILESSISFELEVPTLEDFQNRIRHVLVQFPWLVCEMDGEIVGYAYAGTFRVRAAYARTVESAVYIRKGYEGRGIGSALYRDLFARLETLGIATVIAGVTLPNPASIALHESFGFKKVAHLEKVGFKMNQWWDVGYWQLLLLK